jgi:hypothetical protein
MDDQLKYSFISILNFNKKMLSNFCYFLKFFLNLLKLNRILSGIIDKIKCEDSKMNNKYIEKHFQI